MCHEDVSICWLLVMQQQHIYGSSHESFFSNNFQCIYHLLIPTRHSYSSVVRNKPDISSCPLLLCHGQKKRQVSHLWKLELAFNNASPTMSCIIFTQISTFEAYNQKMVFSRPWCQIWNWDLSSLWQMKRRNKGTQGDKQQKLWRRCCWNPGN